jgi:hypothetical protein
MGELKNLGYVRYCPSYHPMKGTKVSLLGRELFQNRSDPKLNSDLAGKKETEGLDIKAITSTLTRIRS